MRSKKSPEGKFTDCECLHMKLPWEPLPKVCSGSEEGSCVRLVDFVSLSSRLESNQEEEEGAASLAASAVSSSSSLLSLQDLEGP